MATKKAAMLAVAATMLASSATLAEEPGPYINLGLGASFLEGLSVTGVNGRTFTLNENVGGLGTTGPTRRRSATWQMGSTTSSRFGV